MPRISCKTYSQYCAARTHDVPSECHTVMSMYYGTMWNSQMFYSCPTCFMTESVEYSTFFERHEKHLSQFYNTKKAAIFRSRNIMNIPQKSALMDTFSLNNENINNEFGLILFDARKENIVNQIPRISCKTYSQYCAARTHDVPSECHSVMSMYYGTMWNSQMFYSCPTCFMTELVEYSTFFERHEKHLSQFLITKKAAIFSSRNIMSIPQQPIIMEIFSLHKKKMNNEFGLILSSAKKENNIVEKNESKQEIVLTCPPGLTTNEKHALICHKRIHSRDLILKHKSPGVKKLSIVRDDKVVSSPSVGF